VRPDIRTSVSEIDASLYARRADLAQIGVSLYTPYCQDDLPWHGNHSAKTRWECLVDASRVSLLLACSVMCCPCQAPGVSSSAAICVVLYLHRASI